MARALKEFVDEHGVLVLRGSIPDMASDSDSYMNLQRVYKQKARDDASVIASRVQELLALVGKPADTISEAEISLLCKNAAFLRVVRCRSLQEEYTPATFNKTQVGS